MTPKLLAATLLCLSGSLAHADAVSIGGRHHLGPQDLYERQARVLQSDRPGYFRVLVTPNLIPRPPAMVAAVGAGRAYCGRLGKTGLRLRRVERHADQDITAWAMDFSCR